MEERSNRGSWKLAYKLICELVSFSSFLLLNFNSQREEKFLRQVFDPEKLCMLITNLFPVRLFCILSFVCSRLLARASCSLYLRENARIELLSLLLFHSQFRYPNHIFGASVSLSMFSRCRHSTQLVSFSLTPAHLVTNLLAARTLGPNLEYGPR